MIQRFHGRLVLSNKKVLPLLNIILFVIQKVIMDSLDYMYMYV